jgi:hypothetical protein
MAQKYENNLNILTEISPKRSKLCPKKVLYDLSLSILSEKSLFTQKLIKLMSNLSIRVQAFNFKISKTNFGIIVEKTYFQQALQHKAKKGLSAKWTLFR